MNYALVKKIMYFAGPIRNCISYASYFICFWWPSRAKIGVALTHASTTCTNATIQNAMMGMIECSNLLSLLMYIAHNHLLMASGTEFVGIHSFMTAHFVFQIINNSLLASIFTL